MCRARRGLGCILGRGDGRDGPPQIMSRMAGTAAINVGVRASRSEDMGSSIGTWGGGIHKPSVFVCITGRIAARGGFIPAETPVPNGTAIMAPPMEPYTSQY